ncbi:MAG: cytochrome c3 family protein [Desulfosarcina sp.]|nr:cytochrome c3 family protein [Desulfosarcina sp.]MBC2744496.1 cytochrome c3 family protein [Desulfosarcina sp.]MBC2767406.1 cytochrome c3 family protein [Desulfosarcina sp.]
MSRNFVVVAIVTALIFILPMAAASAANRGPDQIDIFGGERGKIPFPHAKHQDNLKDCNICHSVFPQEADAIKTLKAQGTLKKKKVMNLQCIKCHKQEKKAGKPHGPVTCSTCHVK